MAPAKGLINCLWTGSQTALERGQREANGTFATTILKTICAIHFFGDIGRHGFVKGSFSAGELVGGGIGSASGKSRVPSSAAFLFDHPPHEVGNIYLVGAVPKFSVEPVRVEQGKEELEVRPFPVVRSRGH